MWKWIIGVVVAVIAVASNGSDTPSQKVTPVVPEQGIVSQQSATGSQSEEKVKPVEEVKPAVTETVKTVAPVETLKSKTTVTPSCGEEYYRNVDGVCVHRPSASPNAVPSGATARCRDGSYSYSLNHRGTCSHHGGVASWL